MAIKNTPLGGTDWATNDVLQAADLNDTFDAAFNALVKNARFWDNTLLRTLYDDCGSGAAVLASKWTASGSGTHSESYVNSAEAGGTAYELRVRAGSAAGTNVGKVVSNANTANRSYHMRLFIRFIASASSTSGTNADAYAYFVLKDSAGTDQDYEIAHSQADHQSAASTSHSHTQYLDITIVNTATDTYDVYAGGKKIVSGGTTQAGVLVFGFKSTTNDNGGSTLFTADIQIDDVYMNNTA